MRDGSESSCFRCPIRGTCRTAGDPGGADVPAARVVGLSVLYFLVPIVTAIVAAAAVSEPLRIAAAGSAFLATVIIVAGAGRVWRTGKPRSPERQRSEPGTP